MFNQEVSVPALLVLPVLSAYLLLVAVTAIMLARENLRGTFRQILKRLRNKD